MARSSSTPAPYPDPNKEFILEFGRAIFQAHRAEIENMSWEEYQEFKRARGIRYATQ